MIGATHPGAGAGFESYDWKNPDHMILGQIHMILDQIHMIFVILVKNHMIGSYDFGSNSYDSGPSAGGQNRMPNHMIDFSRFRRPIRGSDPII